jgi:DNA-binding SARP family transcriptional activator
MNPIRSMRRLVRALASLLVLGALVVGAPLLLTAIARSRFGGPAPWSGLTGGIVNDGSGAAGVLTAPLSESAVVDLVLRAALGLGWVAVLVVAVSTITEIGAAVRRGGVRSMSRSGASWSTGPARWIAAGLLALVPMVSTVRAPARPALAEFGLGPSGVAASSASTASSAPGPLDTMAGSHSSSMPVSTAVPAVSVVHTVEPGDTLSGIAAEHLDDPQRWREIWDDNRDRQMPDGRTFSDPNLIHPGWPLVVEIDTGAPFPADPDDAEPVAVEVDETGSVTAEAPETATSAAESGDPATGPEGSSAPDGEQVADASAASVPALDTAHGTELDTALDRVLTTVEPPPAVTLGPGSLVGGAAEPVDGAGISDPLGDRSFPVGLGHAAMISTGVLALVAARRRQQLRRATPHARVSAPSAVAASTERLLRSIDAGERLVRADVAVRAAASAVADAGHRVVAVLVEQGGAVELRLDGEAPVHPPYTTPDGAPSGDRWLLPAAVPIELVAPRARLVSMPCVAMVELGRTPDGRDVIVDLEALGTLAVIGPDAQVDAVVRGIALTLATSPFAEVAHLVAVGVPDEAFADHRNVYRCPDVVTGVELVSELVGSTVLHEASTFELRTRHTGGEPWEPAVLLVARSAATPLARSTSAGPATGTEAVPPAGPSIATVLGADHPTATARLRRDGPMWCLEPLGVELTPVGLTRDELSSIAALLADAETDLEAEGRTETEAGSGVGLDAPAHRGGPDGDAPGEQTIVTATEASALRTTVAGAGALDHEPEWSLMVRLFGPVDVVDRDGRAAVFERSKTRELLAWLATHRERSTRAAARTALWELDVRDATFSNVVSEARRAMARLVPPPDGGEWLARTLTESLPLHPAVVTDVDLVEWRLATARCQPPELAIATLMPAAELIRGVPFEGTTYLWPDAEGLTSRLVLLATSVTAELAGHHLALGDVDGVFRATDRGLRVLPGHEGLIALRMRARARIGDHAGLRHEWASYERVLTADPWSDGEPTPELARLRHELLRTT